MAHVAIIVANDYEDVEFQVPYDRLRDAGHKVTVMGRKKGERLHGKKGNSEIVTDASPDLIDPEHIDMLLVPGGYSPDKLRTDEAAVQFVKDVHRHGKPIAAICHAGSLLIDAEIVDGVRITSWPSIKRDLKNAGAIWEDRPVVEDGNIVSSRGPDDLDAFMTAVLDKL